MSEKKSTKKLAAHLFRTEYGRMVGIVSRFLGHDQIETAEDIVQDTLLAAVNSWQHHGIPENPPAWLYKTAKNKTLNYIKRQSHVARFASEQKLESTEILSFSQETIADEQLRMMFACCHPKLSEEIQIALVLKILCGFSIAEIAAAFYTSTETINKRLVRGRKRLREHEAWPGAIVIKDNYPVVLKTIFLIFNEGYLPSKKNETIRIDLTLEAIRLAEILAAHHQVEAKFECHALLALMYLNASRFAARVSDGSVALDMENMDRSLWDKELIDKGLFHLDRAQTGNKDSRYLIMAGISANHCIAPTYDETSWKEILALYDAWLEVEDNPMIRLNRAVALSRVYGIQHAIRELKNLETEASLVENFHFQVTLGTLYHDNGEDHTAEFHLKKAAGLCDNERDKKFLKNKFKALSLF